jgi:hypothetical protein
MLFISHDQDDEAPLSQLKLIVKLAGIAWWNPSEMQAGLLLRDQLRAAIRDCDVCLFLATRRSVGSSWCRAELGAFWGAGKRVISLLQDSDLTDADLPPQLQGDLWTRDAEKALDAIRGEIALAKAHRPQRDAEIKRAVCRVRVAGRTLVTGYLVAPDLVACPDCAPEKLDANETPLVRFGDGEEAPTRVVTVDRTARTAILSLERPPADVAPVRFAEVAQVGASCRGFGYPTASKGSGLPLSCEVVDANHVDRWGTWIAVHSPIFASGPPQGLAGSPIWTDQGVIGSVYGAVLTHDKDAAAFGIMFVTPAPIVMTALAGVMPLGKLTNL